MGRTEVPRRNREPNPEARGHDFTHGTGSAEGFDPSAGGTGVSPVFGFITPFLARKGDGGMVETACKATTPPEQSVGAQSDARSPGTEGCSSACLL